MLDCFKSILKDLISVVCRSVIYLYFVSIEVHQLYNGIRKALIDSLVLSVFSCLGNNIEVQALWIFLNCLMIVARSGDFSYSWTTVSVVLRVSVRSLTP